MTEFLITRRKADGSQGVGPARYLTYAAAAYPHDGQLGPVGLGGETTADQQQHEAHHEQPDHEHRVHSGGDVPLAGEDGEAVG